MHSIYLLFSQELNRTRTEDSTATNTCSALNIEIELTSFQALMNDNVHLKAVSFLLFTSLL